MGQLYPLGSSDQLDIHLNKIRPELNPTFLVGASILNVIGNAVMFNVWKINDCCILNMHQEVCVNKNIV